MGEFIFVGLGLHDERGISLRAVEEIKRADFVFAELYTSLMSQFSINGLEQLVERKITVVSRQVLEEEGGEIMLHKALNKRVAFLVPGDPLIATTHIDLRIRAEKQGIRTRIIHGASIVSAAMGLSGLQNYKYGRSVTIPFSDERQVYDTPYRVITENMKRGLHTLCFLDSQHNARRYMTVKEGLKLMERTEKRKKQQTITPQTIVVGIARAGSRDSLVRAGYLKEVMDYEFGDPPHSIVFPGKLHFMEAEALVTLAKAPEQIKVGNI